MSVLDHRELGGFSECSPPWYFRLGRNLNRHRIRGGDRLLRIARGGGLLDRLAVYPLEHGVALGVPLWRPCNCWDARDVHGYEAELIGALATSISKLEGPVMLIDCGADIGTISVLLAARCRNLTGIVAIEPNRAAFAVLAHNLERLRMPSFVRNAAASDFRGRGRLVEAPDDPSAHAMHVVEDPRGDVAVVRVDDFDLPPGQPCVIKIDVEGTEREVIRGASRTIRGASEVIVAFEAHPRVVRRTGQDPSEVMRTLRDIRRTFTFAADTEGDTALSPDRPFFEQVRPAPIYNVIARAVRDPAAP